MYSKLLMLGAATFCLAASTSFATASELQPVPRAAQAAADRLLRDAGLDANTSSVSVRARIDLDGRVTGTEVLHSSGAPETDRKVEAVLKRVVRAYPPIGLSNGSVTLRLGDPAVLQAYAR